MPCSSLVGIVCRDSTIALIDCKIDTHPKMDPNEEIIVDDNGHCDLRYRGWEQLDERLFDIASRITSLDLSHNALTELPKSIGFLSNLQELNVACNNIASIDEEGIAKLKQLRVLKINGNAITSLPSSIGKCKKLEQLIASENQIREVPASLAECQSLQILKLQHNNISDIPLELHRLSSSIEELDLSGNTELTMIPADVRDNATVVMWILTTHVNKRDDICKLEMATEEAKQRMEASMDASERMKKEIATLSEQKKTLETDLASVATYLRHRRRVDGHKAKIRATKKTIHTIFELKADKVAALS